MTQAEIDILQGLVRDKLPCVYVCEPEEIKASVSLIQAGLIGMKKETGDTQGFYRVFLIS